MGVKVMGYQVGTNSHQWILGTKLAKLGILGFFIFPLEILVSQLVCKGARKVAKKISKKKSKNNLMVFLHVFFHVVGAPNQVFGLGHLKNHLRIMLKVIRLYVSSQIPF